MGRAQRNPSEPASLARVFSQTDNALKSRRPGIKAKQHTASKLIVARVRSNMLCRRMNVPEATSDRIVFEQCGPASRIEKQIDRLHGRFGCLCRGETDDGALAQCRGATRCHVIPCFLHRLEEKST